MRSYLFEPASYSEKPNSIVSIDQAEDYDFAHLDGVAKEYDPVPISVSSDDTSANPLYRTFYIFQTKLYAFFSKLWQKIRGMTRKQKIIVFVSAVVISIVLGFTLGYLTPDDEDTPYPASYYHHLHELELETQTYTITEGSQADEQEVAYISTLGNSSDLDGALLSTANPDDSAVNAEEDSVLATGFFGSLFGVGNLFGSSSRYSISQYQFEHLEELALVNNVAYCIPSPGISYPFNCTRACEIFYPGVEIVTSFTNTAYDTSCTGYIAVDHRPGFERILLVFRGTQTFTNWLTNIDTLQIPYKSTSMPCPGCTVHRGFYTSYVDTKDYITPTLKDLIKKYPEYSLLVTGHSLGGAIAVLAGADLLGMGYKPEITTFGQPRVGNSRFADFFDFLVLSSDIVRYRVTHKSDPVPQVPSGADYKHDSNEIYISKGPLSPSPEDCYICEGQEDSECSYGEGVVTTLAIYGRDVAYRAHVEYFTRVGLCRFQI
ncbi:Alpha/Beta hydrolase protein [Lipomyces oligophaga]|uniref:Alpha/Beta hydrolase protein n=1 Tax=Lipomyces oligophaga TaxID=45792 RepID=UPI0034CF9676